MSDDEIVRAWERHGVPVSGISHLDHVRIAWVLLRRHHRDDAERRLVEGTRRNCEAHGVPDRFDETLTRRWVSAVAEALEARDPGGDFEAFVAAHPELRRGDLFGRPG